MKQRTMPIVLTLVATLLVAGGAVIRHQTSVRTEARIERLEAERTSLQAELEGWTPECLRVAEGVVSRFPYIGSSDASDRGGACSHLIEQRPGELNETMIRFLR